jgi:hypothetical protein
MISLSGYRDLLIYLLSLFNRYICSRVFLFNPPGEIRELHLHPNAPEELKRDVERLERTEAEVNQWFCVIVLGVAIPIMATTAEWVSRSLFQVLKWPTANYMVSSWMLSEMSGRMAVFNKSESSSGY